jgi:hypothetical protein
VVRNYKVTLKCPHGDADELLLLRNRDETLEQILNASWHFECPVHGVQSEIPVGAREIGAALSPEAQPNRVTARIPKATRRSLLFMGKTELWVLSTKKPPQIS